MFYKVLHLPLLWNFHHLYYYTEFHLGANNNPKLWSINRKAIF